MKVTLNKWHIKLGITPIYYSRIGLEFHCGIFKIHTIPPEGEMLQRKHYYGFWFRKELHGFIVFDL